MIDVDAILRGLEAAGNLRRLPHESDTAVVDLSSNDYLGLADDMELRRQFIERNSNPGDLLMTASASRLLASRQRDFDSLESLLSESYGGRAALLFNSGYHANTGIVSALGSAPSTIIIADKLVHASIIDGIKLSGAPFERFRHNDYGHLERLLQKHAPAAANVLVIVESVYSMDGDRAPLAPLVELKRRWPNIILYVDEAHAVGALGPAGLGCAAAECVTDDIDVIIGTLGKALASSGAFAIVDPGVREFLVNKARSLIFSTAMAPLQVRWTELMWRTSLHDDWRRDHLAELSQRLARAIGSDSPSHIQPIMTGDATLAVELSARLLEHGFKVLPIRTPTVPPGTERLRLSLSASIASDDIERLAQYIKR